MTIPQKLDDLVVFVGDDSARKAEMRALVVDLATKPEIMDILKKAYELHGEPLLILADATNEGDMPAYYENARDHKHTDKDGRVWRGHSGHLVHVDLTRLKGVKPTTLTGEVLNTSPQLVIAHEFFHAADATFSEAEDNLIKERIEELKAKHFPQIDWKDYQNRITAAKHQRIMLMKIFGEIYDKAIAPNQSRLKEIMTRALGDDPVLKAYNDKHEEPAIAFSNLIVTKYYGQPPQHLNYFENDFEHSMEFLFNRKQFVKTFADRNTLTVSKDWRNAYTESRRGRDPSEIRADASPIASGSAVHTP